MRLFRKACVAALLAVGIGSATADADLYCVDVADPGCVPVTTGATPGARLASALAVAASHSGDDTVRFGPGSYAANGFAASGGPGQDELRLEGPGAGAATLRYATTRRSTTTLSLSGAVAASGFGVELPPGGGTTYGISSAVGLPEISDVAVADLLAGAPQSPIRAGVAFADGGSLVRATLSGANFGVDASGSGAVSIQESDISGGNAAVRVAGRTNDDPVAITASRLRATKPPTPGEAVVGLWAWDGRVTTNAVEVSSAGSGVVQLCDGATPSLTMQRTTIDPAANGNALEIFCGDTRTTATTSLSDSLLVPPAPIAVGTRPGSYGARLDLATTRYDGPASVRTSGGGSVFAPGAGLTTVAPAFVSATDLHLAPGSPLIDGLPAAAPSVYTGTILDPAGGFLRRDGDGDGVARRDYGAYENQPAAIPLPAGNLLAAPGAEGPGAATTNVAAPAPPAPWTRTAGSFTFGAYGASFFPKTALAALLGAGSNVFLGGPDAAHSSAQQVVDLSAAAAAIDTGGASATLSGLLGGYGGEEDVATVTASFRAADGAALGALRIGPVTPDQRDTSTSLMPGSDTRPIPAGTRSVVVVLEATRVSADPYDDASFDNLALTAALPSAPPPGGGGDRAPGGNGGGGGRPVPAPPRGSAYRGVVLPIGTRRLDARGRITLPLVCPVTAQTRCTGTLAATTRVRTNRIRPIRGTRRIVVVYRTVRLGSVRLDLAAGVHRRVKLTIARGQRHRVTAAGLKAALAARTRDAGAAKPVVTTGRATLLPPKRAAKPRARRRR